MCREFPHLFFLSVVVCLLMPRLASAQLVVGPGAGGLPEIRVIDATGERSFLAYDPAFLGGVNVTLGDIDGDGTPDVITGPGPGGGPHVRVLSGTDFSELASFFAYDPAFSGGVFVAAGDVNGDGRADIITGAGPGGGPHVRVFSGADLSVLASFFAYDPAFSGGVSVAAGDVNGDGRADIVTGAGAGGGPHVRAFSGADLSVLASFFAYDPAFPGGVSVAAGDLNGDGRSDIITGAGPNGGPHVRAFSGADLSELASFFAYDPAFVGGVSVAAGDFNDDGRTDLITGAGPGGGPHVRVFSGIDLSELASFLAGGGSSGVSVGSLGDRPGLRFTSPDTTTFTVGSAGTFNVTTVGQPPPAITVTGPLPFGVTFVDNGNGTGTIAGTPGAATGGTYPLTFTANNGTGTPVTQTFTLTVNEPPAITSATATTFTIGSAGTFTVTTTGGPTPTITRSGATLPTGITFVDNGNGTATLSGTAAAGTAGSYAFQFTASNGIGTDAVQNFTLTVSGAPLFTSANTTTFTVGSPGTFAVTTVGTPAPAITLSGALPTGVTFVDNGDGTGTLSGTPGAGAGGVYPLTLTAANGLPPDATQAFTLNVHQAPAIASASSTTFTIGAAGSFTVTTTGFPAPTIARSGAALPAGVTFVDNGDGSGTLSGTPAAGTGGSYALTFTATNLVGASTPQAFTLTVSGGPAFTSASTTTFTVGSPGTFTVTAVGTPPPSITLTGTLPTGVTFVNNGNGTGTLSGTPAAGTGGVHALTLTAANGVLPDATQAFTLNINAAPAITSAASTTFIVGAAGTFTVTTTGFPAPTLTRGGVALPGGVTFVDNGNGTGTLSGTPAAGTGGTYALTFTATNVVGSSAVQAFTLTVNQPPAFTSAASTTFTVGSASTFTITTTGVPPATTIARSGAALPTGVSFTDNANGTATLAGTPAAGTSGTYALIFTINNGVGGNVIQNFTLNIQEPPAITSANTTTFTVGTPGTFTVTTTGFPVPTVSQSGSLPTGVTFTPGTRVLAGTATQTGAFPLVFTATNAIPPDAIQNFTLNVVCPTITVTPLILPDGLYQTAYVGVDFNQTGSTGSTFTWAATGLAAGLNIDVNTGVVSGTPTNTVLNGVVVITVTDNFGCTGTVTPNPTLTIRPTTDNETFSGGVGNTQYVVGAAVPPTPHVFSNDNVKTGDNGPGTLTVTFPATAANGTLAEGVTDGTFTYTPNLGFAGLSDTFNYTLTDGNGVTNTGTVTINLSNVVWYVNSTGPNGDGRSHSPFNTLNNAAAPSLTNQFIYVHTGGATTAGNLAMDTPQTLHGQGATFSLNGLTILAGTPPTLTGTVTLANSTVVRGVNFAPLAGIPAMTGSAVTGSVTIDQVNVTGGTSAVSLTNVSGAVTVTSANFTNTTGAEVLISQGTGNLDVNAVISSNAGRSIDIQNRTGGTVTFTGAITDTGQGVFLNANTGSTINFTGGLALTTGGNPGFTATGGGTVSATQNNTTIVNTITTTTGTALNVANTTIGAGGLTFRSISAGTGVTGPANGILLNLTGALGGLKITGDGGSTNNGSGGTIQNTTGHGVSLNNTSHVEFDQLNVTSTGGSGINGMLVTNFTYTNGTVSNSGNAVGESNIAFNGSGTLTGNNIAGILTVTGSTLTNAFDSGLDVQSNDGTISHAIVTNNTITSSNSTATSKGTGINFVGTGNASTVHTLTRATITGNTVRNFPSNAGIQINYNSTNPIGPRSTAGIPGDPTNIILISGNTVRGESASNRFGTSAIILSQNGGNSSQRARMNFDVANNGTVGSPMGDALGTVILIGNNGYSDMTGTVSNNVIVANNTVGSPGIGGGNGIVVSSAETPDLTLTVTSNSISLTHGNGILLVGRGVSGLAKLGIRNNTVSAPTGGFSHGIRVDAGNASSGDDAICLDISGNTAAGGSGSGLTAAGIGLRKHGTNATLNDFGIEGMAATSSPGVENYVGGLNPGSADGIGDGSINGVLLISATSGFSSCTSAP